MRWALILISQISVHQWEFKYHEKGAVWTPVEYKPQPFTPLYEEPKGMLKAFYGYLPYWIDTTFYKFFQMELLTHIAYFSVIIDSLTGALGSIPNAYRFTAIRDYAHSMGVRVHMTFTIFGSSGVSLFLQNPTARNNAIQNIKNFITNYGIDGVNIDFEFVTQTVRDSFNRFINDLAYELWNFSPRKELYIAVPPVPEWYPGYDYYYLSTHSDGLFVMAYDFHYSGSSIAGPVSPAVPSTFWGSYSVAKSIGSIKAQGVDGSRIILGLPYYGYDWPTSSSNMGSSTTASGTAVHYFRAYQNSQAYGRLWDSYSLTPWYRYTLSGAWHQCWYDDSVSLDIKFSFVNDSSLKGGGCWALGYDSSYSHIWSVIRKNFWVRPPLRHFVVEVNIPNLNLREGPGTQYPVISVLSQGTKLAAFDYYNNWYKVYYPSASGPYYGWVWGGDGINYQYLRGSTGDTLVEVTGTLVNVREGPGTSYNVITQITKGQVFVMDSTNGNWARIFIPNVNGHSQGWVSLTYLRLIPNPEDSNTYNANILEIQYPPSLQSNDTFTITLKVKNTGFSPFDTLILLRFRQGHFFNPSTWIDTLTARPSTYEGLPNQTFYVTCLLKAPEVSRDTLIADTFQFVRKGIAFGPKIAISLLVTSLEEHQFRENFEVKIPTLFSKTLNIEIPRGHDLTVEVYDPMGRRVSENKVQDKVSLEIGADLKPGPYFIILRKGNTILTRKKVVKVN